MKCIAGCKVEMHKDTSDVPYTYDGESTVIENVTGAFCPRCGASVFLDAAESQRVSVAMPSFDKNGEKRMITVSTPRRTTQKSPTRY